MKSKVVIIGGGVAGLSAGIYSAMNGFDTEILEMHSVAGGQCTAWDRKKYRFDYCLHWLVGTSKGPFHEIWKETNVLTDTTEIIDHEIHSQIIDQGGQPIYHLYQYRPVGKIPPRNRSGGFEAPIRSMCKEMRKSALLEPFTLPPELRSPLDYVRILSKMFPLLG